MILILSGTDLRHHRSVIDDSNIALADFAVHNSALMSANLILYVDVEGYFRVLKDRRAHPNKDIRYPPEQLSSVIDGFMDDMLRLSVVD